jgi:hypothetical protein
MRRFAFASAFSIFALVACLWIQGCATQGRVAYNTLAAVYTATDTATKSYLDLVMQGQVKTNSVPTVMRAWDGFRAVWSTAVIMASGNTNAPVTDVVTGASSNVVYTINTAKLP